jgi:hypothetical protein
MSSIRRLSKKLCRICHQPGHQARQCPLHCKNKKGGKVATVGGNAPSKDELSEEDFLTLQVPMGKYLEKTIKLC